MFCFFVGEEFKGFWSNQVGDKFVDLTITKMKWPKEQVSVAYYDGLQDTELQNAAPSMLEVRVNREVINEVSTQVGVNEETQEPIFEITNETTLELVRIVPADSFMVNGLMLKPC